MGLSNHRTIIAQMTAIFNQRIILFAYTRTLTTAISLSFSSSKIWGITRILRIEPGRSEMDSLGNFVYQGLDVKYKTKVIFETPEVLGGIVV
jgi:hypothetical protein